MAYLFCMNELTFGMDTSELLVVSFFNRFMSINICVFKYIDSPFQKTDYSHIDFYILFVRLSMTSNLLKE